MSLPSYRLRCTQCDFDQTDCGSPVKLQYVLAEGCEIIACRRPCWCYTCDNLTDGEHLDTTFSWAKEAITRGEISGNAVWIVRAWFAQRKSPPRCLRCGSTKIISLLYNKDGVAEGFKHKCGGVFVRKEDPSLPRFMWNFDASPTVLLSPEGDVIRSEVDSMPVKQDNAPRVNADTRDVTPRPRRASESPVVECKVLLDACTPLVYVQNAFRITGLAVDASARDIKRRIDDLKHAEELGDAATEHTHAFALDPPPTLENIREAAQRLQDPECRIVEEFFWFWPEQWGGGREDTSLSALVHGDKDTAFKSWSSALSSGTGASAVVAKHNLAVMYQLVALDSEWYALEGELNSDQLQTIAKYWRTSFKWWEDLTTAETFWSLVTDRIRMLADPRLTTGFARRMRATLPEALDKINAMLAVAFFEKGKHDLGRNHVTYMLETHQGMDDVPKTLAIVTKPLKTRILSGVEKAQAAAQREPKKAAQSARDLLNAVAEPLKIIQMILPATDHERIDLCDSVAETCLTCQLAFARETKDWATSRQLLDSAKGYAASQETKARIEENIITVINNQLCAQYLDPLADAIARADSRKSVSEKLNAIQADVLPMLKAIEGNPNITREVLDKCADLVAQYVRNLSVKAYNENGDLPSSMRILEIAIATARGAEARAQLQNDKSHLAGIRAEATKHNAHVQIRSDNIEVTNEFVRYNNQKFPVSHIQGVKFGVFHQYTNGIKTSSSYLIDISGGHSGHISIECKRVFRSESQAENDFNSILQAIFHQVAPSLVQRLAEGILAGRPLAMGDARLTRDGVFITTGSLWWKKETLVPWSVLRYGTYQGQLSLSSSEDKGISTSMALRDTWNAVFFEFIAKAVVELKS